MTQWPRGLIDYVPAGPADAVPSLDEERTGNRLHLAARLLAVLRSQGREVDREVRELREAEHAYANGEIERAARLVDGLLTALDERPR